MANKYRDKDHKSKVSNKGFSGAESDEQSSKKKKKENFSEHIAKSRIRNLILENISVFVVLFILAFILILGLSVATQATRVSFTEERTEDYIQRTITIRDDLENNMDYVNDVYTEEKIRELLSMNDIYVYTNSLWDYTFEVNNFPVATDEITVEPDENGKIIIRLIEEKQQNPLPESIVNIGSVTRGDAGDSLDRHISVSSGDLQREIITEEYRTVFEYVWEDFDSGESVVFEISDQLCAKINNPFNYITFIAE